MIQALGSQMRKARVRTYLLMSGFYHDCQYLHGLVEALRW